MVLLRELLADGSKFYGKNVLVIGYPATGKTFVAEQLHTLIKDHTFIHTDDYMSHGFEQSLYVMMEDIEKTHGSTLIEGLLGYRLLRKGLELGTYRPDIVIDLRAPEERIIKTYEEERDPGKIKSVLSTCKACRTILEKYLAMQVEHQDYPEWITIQNNY